jgi:hypothetical protein
MSDQEKGLGLGDLGDSGVAPSSDPNGSGSQNEPTPDWRTELIPEDLREEKMWADIKTPQDAMKMLHSSQKLLGKEKIVRPDADSPPEVWDEFYKVAGRPESAEKYDFAEDFTDEQKGLFDEEGLNKFKELAYQEGVSSKAFQSMIKFYADFVGESNEALSASANEAIQAGLNELKAEWRGEDFSNNTKIAQSALEQLGDENLTKLIMDDPKLRNNPSLIKLFHRIGQSQLDDTPLATGTGTALKTDSVTHARQQLREFEEKNADVLMAHNYQGPKNREEVLAQRFQLLRKAYPERPSVDGSAGFSEFEIPV